ncbi:MAG: hypothetical protein FK734_20060 [Asgard group archaeon]|nr:hypothetical protein [Asgard group archaeon]
MIRELWHEFTINNPINTGLLILGVTYQWFFLLTTLTMLSLLIWSIILFTRIRKQNPTSEKYLPRVIGFTCGFVLAAVGLTLGLIYLS